ncbi:MAG TPA: hypothetical protein VFK82_08520, partial [Burkholderiaceae bacterium]|nr:hypothetical protein [Burkholderiaceae bacterium]
LVADAVVVPAGDEPLYGETILRLPRCYQVNDDRRVLPAPAPRAALGLPEDALVLCNFNQAFKWSAPYLEVWLDALRSCPDAVLWLLDPGVGAREAIVQSADRAGVAGRLHWAPRLPAAQHLARLGAADLALDQLPVASHTTAADALWMAVPVLTQLGEGFHGRVAASLLQAVELEHWVARDFQDYADKLQALLQEPGRIDLAGSHLAAQRLRLPLFDTTAFARDWETLLRSLCES